MAREFGFTDKIEEMSPGKITLAIVGVVFFNALIVLGVWLWFHRGAPPHSAEESVPMEMANSADAGPSTSQLETFAAGTLNIAPLALESSPSASFDTPQENQPVPRRFQASGRCAPVPAGQRLMLVVQTGRVFSPKMPPLVPDGDKWSGTVNEYGMPVGAGFTLCLFQVSEAGVDEIAQWHAQGKATGKYPPYREVPGGACLAKIRLRVAGGGNG